MLVEIGADESRAQAFDLLLDGGADVEGAHHRAQAPGSSHRLQPCDSGAEDEDPSRQHGPRGGHEHGEELPQRIGRQ